MGSFSDYLENKLLDHIVGKTSFTMPVNAYVALSTANPLDTGAGIAEPSGGAYARKQTVAADWTAAAAGATSNAVAITFATATASWGTIAYFAVFDALTAGNMLFHGTITPSKLVSTGDTAAFAIGDLDVTLD